MDTFHENKDTLTGIEPQHNLITGLKVTSRKERKQKGRKR